MVDGELEEPRIMGTDCGVDQIRSAEEQRVEVELRNNMLR